jgi:VWFA-related protein
VHQELIPYVHGTGAAVAVLLGVIAALESRGQTPAPQTTAELTTSRDSPATFSTKVNLVMVPVVVRDSKGKAIGTLQKEDFQLFDKGKPQVITRFSVEKGGESSIPAVAATDDSALEKSVSNATPKAAGPIAERYVLCLFDDVHTTNSDLMQVRNAADKHLAESLGATTRAAIFTTSGQGNLDFTDDRAKLHDALMKLMSRPTLGGPGSECPDISYYWADLIYNKNDPSALQAAASMAMGSCSPPPAGTTPAAIQAAQQAAQSMAQSTASRIVSQGDRDTRLAFVTLENAIRRLSAAPGDRTLILLSSGFLITDDLRFEESEIMDRAIRANVRISSLNARGL